MLSTTSIDISNKSKFNLQNAKQRRLYQSEAEYYRLTNDILIEEHRRLIGLWRAVINQALCDLKSNSKKVEAISEKKRAMKWFTGHNNNFFMVCALAELDAYTVLDQAWEIINRDDFLKEMKLEVNP